MWEKTDPIKLPTSFGDFQMTVYRDINTGEEYSAIYKGTWTKNESVLLRLHSSCLTGDIFGSERCDCGPQLHETMRLIEKMGKGVVIYLPHEGRGIGLFNKIRAYKLQENGFDTVQANLELGFDEDLREFDFAGLILADMDITSVKVMTNNPFKVDELKMLGVKVSERVDISIQPNKHNKNYLETKRVKMNHHLNEQLV